MKFTRLARILFINLVVGITGVSPFLPGPSNDIVNLLFNAGQLLGVFGLVATPIGILWTLGEFARKKKQASYSINVGAIYLTTIPLTLLMTSILFAGYARDFSRGFAMDRAEKLIQSIGLFKAKNGRFPDSLAELSPDYIYSIPSPGIMGIDQYYYDQQDGSYTISFNQNVTLGFNFEVITYNAEDHHKSEGENPILYKTGKDHWRYYVYD